MVQKEFEHVWIAVFTLCGKSSSQNRFHERNERGRGSPRWGQNVSWSENVFVFESLLSSKEGNKQI